MNGLDLAYFHFRARRIKDHKCATPEGRCIICDLMWEGWPRPHCKHEHETSGRCGCNMDDCLACFPPSQTGMRS